MSDLIRTKEATIGSGSLTGKLTSPVSLAGKVSIANIYDVYEGTYNVVPKAFEELTLKTAQMLLEKDITIEKIPYWETGNDSNGKTVYIAEEE